MKVDAVRAKKSKYLPTVLTKDEVLAIIQKLSGVHQLLIKLLYGTGLRLTEGLSIRVKDVDFAQNQIIVRDTKGNESRVTMLPESIAEELKIHLQSFNFGVFSQHSDKNVKFIKINIELGRSEQAGVSRAKEK